MKKEDKRTIVGIVLLAIVAVALIIVVFVGLLDIVTAALDFAVVGVVFYFLFVTINYDHSIYGGRFEEHFGKEEDKKK